MSISSPYIAAQPAVSPYISSSVQPTTSAEANIASNGAVFNPVPAFQPLPASDRFCRKADVNPSTPPTVSSTPTFMANRQGDDGNHEKNQWQWLGAAAILGTLGAGGALVYQRVRQRKAPTSTSPASSPKHPAQSNTPSSQKQKPQDAASPLLAGRKDENKTGNKLEKQSSPAGKFPPNNPHGENTPSISSKPIPSEKSANTVQTVRQTAPVAPDKRTENSKAPAHAVQTAAKNGGGITHEIAVEAEKLAKTGGKSFLRQAAGTVYAAGKAGVSVAWPMAIPMIAPKLAQGLFYFQLLNHFWLEFRHNCKSM